MGDRTGEICALLTALVWAGAVVLFKRSGERVSPVALNLFKNAIGLSLMLVTLPLFGEGLHSLRECAREDIYILLLSGSIGIALADTVFFHALNLIGVGLVSIVDCTYSAFVILFSWWMLGEELSPWHYAGGVLILAAVASTGRMTPPVGRTSGQLVLGVALGASAMAMMAFGIVLAKPVLNDFPLMWAAILRMLAGTLILALVTLASARRATHWRVFRPAGIWKFSVPAAALGAYVSMILWIAGFKYTKAALAGMLNQTSVIFALILASWFLKERFTRRKALAVVLALAGVVLVVWPRA